jgi:hypothetical protein
MGISSMAGGPCTEATAADASAALAAGLVTTGRQRQYLDVQLASGHGLQGGVDGLVTMRTRSGVRRSGVLLACSGGRTPRKD